MQHYPPEVGIRVFVGPFGPSALSALCVPCVPCVLCAVCTVCCVHCVLQSNSKPRPNDHWVTVLTPILPTALARDERDEDDDDEFHREY